MGPGSSRLAKSANRYNVFDLPPCYTGSAQSYEFFLLQEIPVFNANSVDPDQTPQCAASDLGLHSLLISLLFDARLKWVNITSCRTAQSLHRL